MGRVECYDVLAMKTTLTIDPDVAEALKELADVQKKPFEQVVNEALRGAVLSDANGEDPRRKQVRIQTFHSGFMPGIDQMKLNQLNDELMVEEFLEKEKRIRDSKG